MKKIIEAATKVKEDGYIYMASVVKSVYYTTYYHVVKIDDILKKGKWIPCQKGQFGKWHGRIGTSTLPDKCILRATALYRYCK